MAKALVTSEVTETFMAQLEARGYQPRHIGWGHNGIALTEEEMEREIAECEIAIVEVENLSASTLVKAKSLKFIGVARGTPVNVDLEYCQANSIEVATTPGRNANSVADYCVAMILDFSRDLHRSGTHLRNVGWNYEGRLPYLAFRGREVGNLTVGLFGLGAIGSRVAERLHRGFGTRIKFYDPFVSEHEFAEPCSTLDDLFRESDIVSLHAPVTEVTKNSVNELRLKFLGSNGILINSARAGLIEEEALYQALTKKEIKGAVLDVFWQEPLSKDSRWLELNNVMATPHIAGASLDVIDNHCTALLKQLDQWRIRGNQVGARHEA